MGHYTFPHLKNPMRVSYKKNFFILFCKSLRLLVENYVRVDRLGLTLAEPFWYAFSMNEIVIVLGSIVLIVAMFTTITLIAAVFVYFTSTPTGVTHKVDKQGGFYDWETEMWFN